MQGGGITTLFFFLATLVGPQFPDQGSNLGSWQWNYGILTTEPTGNSPTEIFLNKRVEGEGSGVGKEIQKRCQFWSYWGRQMTWVETLSWCLAHRNFSRNNGDQVFWFGQDRLGIIAPSTIISCFCQALGWLMICSPYQQMTVFQWTTSYSPRFTVDVPKAFLKEAGCPAGGFGF